MKATPWLPLALLVSTGCAGLSGEFIVPGPDRDTVLATAGDDIVAIFDPCELDGGEILDGGRGRDTLVLPVARAQVEALGVRIRRFETVVVEPHACLSECGPRPDCGQGRCVDGAGAGQWSCECNHDRLTGSSCDTCKTGYAGPDCGACAPGYHLKHASGSIGARVEADGEAEDGSFGIDWDEHACVPDESCAGVTCSNRGTCNDSTGVAACECGRGYVGLDCEACAPGYEDDGSGGCVLGASCREEACSGRGDCVPDGRGLACACDPGITGARCTECAPGYHGVGATCVPDEACSPSTCSGHGTCSVEGGETRCVCEPDYYGEDCGRTCLANTCGGRGACSVVDGVPRCACSEEGFDPDTDCRTCKPGFVLAGDNCVVPPGCSDDACSGHGVCRDAGSSSPHACDCEAGYAGNTCADCAPGHVRFGADCVRQATCDADACGGNGRCEVAAGRATCRCDAGFFGAACGQTNPPTLVTIQGGGRSVRFGERVHLTAVPVGIGNFGRSFTWRIAQGRGSIAAFGDHALYTPPATGLGLESVVVTVEPDCCLGPTWGTPVKVGNSANRPPIPIDNGGGPNDHLFEPLDRAMIDFMTDRCIGAGAVAVSRYGVEVYRAGYGRLDGAPVDDDDWPWQARCGDDPYKPQSSNMSASTPIRIGSNSKPLLAAVMRDLVAQRIAQVQGDPDGSEIQVDPILAMENIPICPPPAGADYFLLPPEIEDRLCGLLPVDLPQIDAGALESCSQSEPCFNGGTCAYEAVVGPGTGGIPIILTYVPFCTCPCPDPVGDPAHCYSGERCQRVASLEADPPMADPRWRDVTLGHILRHKSGLRSSSKTKSVVAPELGALRNLGSLGALLVEQNKLSFLPNLQDAWTQLQEERGVGGSTDTAFFLPSVTLQEVYRVTAGKPLYSDPLAQTYDYSNSGFSLQQTIVEHLAGQFQEPLADPDEVAPRPFSSLPGEPLLHEGSPLQTFLEEKLGIFGGQGSAYGIFPARFVPSQVGPADLVHRVYSGGAYYDKMEWDEKRPDCVFDAAQCDFAPWQDGKRFNWELEGAEPTKVFAGLEGTGRAAGVGSLVVELPLYLRFMREYYINTTGMGADRSVGYGTPRTSWTQELPHTGSTSNAKSWMVQHPGEVSYSIPPREADGSISLDRTNDELISHGCTLPDGVDVIMSVNQASDKRCDVDTCDLYGRRDDYVLHGLCEVDWESVTLQPVMKLAR